MAVFTALLVAATWPLWTPGTEFPDIPWFGWGVLFPPEPIDWLSLAALGGLLLVQFVPPGGSGESSGRRGLKGAQGALFAGALWLLLTDQHRLQPWVWQMLLWTSVIALSGRDRPRLALESLRGLTLSVYVWSAVSKFDRAFVEGHGQLLLEGLSDAVGLSAADWSPAVRAGLAWCFPAGELLVAALLAVARLRRLGLWGSLAMHVALLLTLGPLGLNHEWGVLLWNGYFIGQNVLLFRPLPAAGSRAGDVERDRTDSRSPRVAVTRLVTLVLCVLPGLSLAGLWDWWPSWAVYSARPEVVIVLVEDADIVRLPASLQAHIGPPRPLSTRCPVNLDAWSFATCWCPMYPQERYRLAVAMAVSREYDAEMTLTIRSSPNRRTGERAERRLDGQALERHVASYWLNVRRRGVTPPLRLDSSDN
jgi:hypothetical protein